ncbi:hypothetical protein [Thiocapsa sp. N5-Cardenillas]|uniref:hypothetical protein n=1 Tax=Thiocapsa sp. N5-Cardenillas TaxID=3137397 RepID=UPI0035ADF34B
MDYLKLALEHYPDKALLESLDRIAEARRLCIEGSWKLGARRLGVKGRLADEAQAQASVRAHFLDMLECDRYIEASALAWSREMFEQRPVFVKRIFEALSTKDMIILLGASGLSKTYTAAAYVSLDFIRDPENTAIKFGSVNDTNLKGNLWSNLQTFVKKCLFPPDVIFNDSRMRIRPPNARPDCGIDAVLFSKQRDSTGKIKGFHPKPFRLAPHPKYGSMTVVRILLDETQELSEGVKADLGSPQSTIDPGTHHMKIILTCNPIDEGKWVVRMAQPRDGWVEERMDELQEWTTSSGWYVLRLDGAKFENVRYRKSIFPGFLTAEAYDGYMQDGQPTASWYIFGRGWPPPGRARETVVPSTWFDHQRGEPTFIGSTQGVMGADIAFLQDRAILAIGRYGLASGYIDWSGTQHRFASRKIAGEFENRHCCVLDRLIQLSSRDNAGVADEIKQWAEGVGIEPKFCVIDMTGNGFGVVSHLQRFWGPVEGIHWKESPTARKILVEDRFPANEQTMTKISEMYWTVRRWIDPRVKGFFVSPNCQGWEELRLQLTTRSYKQVDMRIAVEPKEDYVKRFPRSPDESDATVMMAFAARTRNLPLPALVDEEPPDRTKMRQKGTVFQTADRPIVTGPWTKPQINGLREVRMPAQLMR